MASNLKTQAMLDFEEATAANDVVRGAESKLLNLMLYSAAQVVKLMLTSVTSTWCWSWCCYWFWLSIKLCLPVANFEVDLDCQASQWILIKMWSTRYQLSGGGPVQDRTWGGYPLPYFIKRRCSGWVGLKRWNSVHKPFRRAKFLLNIIQIIKPARFARGPKGPARWER